MSIVCRLTSGGGRMEQLRMMSSTLELILVSRHQDCPACMQMVW